MSLVFELIGVVAVLCGRLPHSFSCDDRLLWTLCCVCLRTFAFELFFRSFLGFFSSLALCSLFLVKLSMNANVRHSIFELGILGLKLPTNLTCTKNREFRRMQF